MAGLFLYPDVGGFSTSYNLLQVSPQQNSRCISLVVILQVSFCRGATENMKTYFHHMEEESGGLCIIDEALYRQTELNTEMLTAQPHRPAVGGWVGGDRGGGSKEQRALLLTLYLQEESCQCEAGYETRE